MTTALPYLAILLLLAVDPPKKPAPPPPPPPLEAPQPFVSTVFPAGGQSGKTVEITATGTNIVVVSAAADGNGVLVTGGGVTGSLIEAKEPNKAKFSLTIAPDAEPGEREIRFVTPGGVSNRYRFFIGEFPEVNEVEPNNDKDKAQRLPALPVVVNGQILDQDRDYFRFTAKAGRMLVCEARARAIVPFIANAVPGWFDPVVTVFDASGRELQYADDFHLKPDPVMFFKVPRDGEYIIELKDVIFRGRADFIYRLTIAEMPYLTSIYPLGGRRGSEVAVELSGVNLPAKTTNVRLMPQAPRVQSVQGLPFAAGDLREIEEVEDNDSPAKAQRVQFPLTINGRIQTAADVDYYTFTAKAGDKLLMEVQARRLDSPLDSILTLYNSKGDAVAENDDWTDPMEAVVTHHADSHLAYTCPASGDYVLRIRDTQGNGGPEYAYRLSITPLQPDFFLRILPDNPRLGQGDTTAITVTAIKKDGFDAAIDLRVEGLPAGFSSSRASIAAGQAEGRITITAPPDAPIGILSPTIVGTAVIGKDTVMRRAFTAEAVQQAFAYTHNVPTKQVFLAVVKPAAYQISTDVPAGKLLQVARESELTIHVKIHRQPGAKGAVSLSAARPAAGITVKSAFIPADKDEATLTLSVAKDAWAGLKHNIIVSAVMKTGKETILRYAPAIPIEITGEKLATAK